MVCPPWNVLACRKMAELQPNDLPPTVALAPDFTAFPFTSRDWLRDSPVEDSLTKRGEVGRYRLLGFAKPIATEKAAALLGKTGTDGWRGTGFQPTG